MAYGMYYDWSSVKLIYRSTLLKSITDMVSLLPAPILVPSIEDIITTYNSLLCEKHHGFIQLLNDFFCYDKGPKDSKSSIQNHDDVVEFQVHNEAPELATNMSVQQWLELFIRSSWFYRTQCFRNHGDPKLQITRPILSVVTKNTRSSSRLAQKPTISYIAMYKEDSNQLTMNHPPKTIELLYQIKANDNQPIATQSSSEFFFFFFFPMNFYYLQIKNTSNPNNCHSALKLS
jgi:hypothetical protein